MLDATRSYTLRKASFSRIRLFRLLEKVELACPIMVPGHNLSQSLIQIWPVKSLVGEHIALVSAVRKMGCWV